MFLNPNYSVNTKFEIYQGWVFSNCQRFANRDYPNPTWKTCEPDNQRIIYKQVYNSRSIYIVCIRRRIKEQIECDAKKFQYPVKQRHGIPKGQLISKMSF